MFSICVEGQGVHNIVPYPLLRASTQQCLPVDSAGVFRQCGGQDLHNIVPYPLLRASTQQCLPVDSAGVFHQCGGARCAHNMVPYPECRQQALNIVQQLVLSPGGDDDMGTLLGLMPTVSVTDLELKTHILKVLTC